MHYIITYATGMYSQLYKISSELHILYRYVFIPV